jgi:alpha-1,3-mannosyltransferase
VLSKRLHSIFVLRCFNDCFAVFFFWLAVFLLQRRQWTVGALTYSLGLGVKMSLLLGLPALGAVLLLGRGFSGSLRLLSLMLQVQIAIAWPFLQENKWGYLSRAFELSRQFLFKWTVNWRFVGEDVFLSKGFAVSLLGLHAVALLLLMSTRWLYPTGKSLAEIVVPMLSLKSPFTEAEEKTLSPAVTPRYVLTTMLTSTVVGMLCARSLHYQFYAYLAWATPFLLWRSGAHPVTQYVHWGMQEWAWNVYPSTSRSSEIVVSALAVAVLLTWRGSTEDFRIRRKDERATQ